MDIAASLMHRICIRNIQHKNVSSLHNSECNTIHSFGIHFSMKSDRNTMENLIIPYFIPMHATLPHFALMIMCRCCCFMLFFVLVSIFLCFFFLPLHWSNVLQRARASGTIQRSTWKKLHFLSFAECGVH